MQERWREEIAATIREVKERERNLLSREEELRRKERQLSIDRLVVEKREALVRERESDLARRDRKARQGAETPPAPRRRGKFKRKNVEISMPTDFKHNVSWDTENLAEHVAAFQGASPMTPFPPPKSPSSAVGRCRRRTATSSSGSLSGGSPLIGYSPMGLHPRLSPGPARSPKSC